MTKDDHVRGLLADGFTDKQEISEITGVPSARVTKLMEKNARRCRLQKLEDHRRYLLTKRA